MLPDHLLWNRTARDSDGMFLQPRRIGDSLQQTVMCPQMHPRNSMAARVVSGQQPTDVRNRPTGPVARGVDADDETESQLHQPTVYSVG